LTTYIAGIPELVRHGENGWLFAAGSMEGLTNAMAECLRAPIEELQRIGDAGYRRIIERHSSDNEAEKLAALFLAPPSTRLTASSGGTPATIKPKNSPPIFLNPRPSRPDS
jgi:hypothetical protein